MSEICEILEAAMVICFGASWPLNIIKLYRAKTAKGTSVMFYFFIWIGYIFGILSKYIKAMNGTSTPAYVLFFYILNITMVSFGILLYFRNRRLDQENQGTGGNHVNQN